MREDGVQTGATTARRPLGAIGVLPETLDERKALAPVVGSEERMRLDNPRRRRPAADQSQAESADASTDASLP